MGPDDDFFDFNGDGDIDLFETLVRHNVLVNTIKNAKKADRGGDDSEDLDDLD